MHGSENVHQHRRGQVKAPESACIQHPDKNPVSFSFIKFHCNLQMTHVNTTNGLDQKQYNAYLGSFPMFD